MGASTAWPSPTLLKMAAREAPITLDITQISWMVSLMFVGHIVSPIPSGYLMESFGRKRTCLWMAVIPFSSWLLILFATSAVHLYIARFLAGLWIGAITTIIPLYVGEVAGPMIRGSLTTLNNLFLNLGTLYVYIIGSFVSYSTLAISCQILTLVFFLMYFKMPESPYHLIKLERRQKALEALSWLRKGETRVNIEAEIQRIEQSLEEQKSRKGTLKDILFDASNRKAISISVVYSVLKRTTGSGVMQAFVSITLPKKTFGTLSPNICVIVIGFISFLSCVFSTGLAIKIKRRTLVTISAAGGALSTAVIAVWFYLNDFASIDVSSSSDVVFLAFVLYHAVFNIGLGPVGTSIKGELFAANVKALSSSITTLTVAFTGFLMNKFYLIITQQFGMYVNYLVFCGSCVVAIIFTWTVVPETHNKTLEEVRIMLRGDKSQSSKYKVYSPSNQC